MNIIVGSGSSLLGIVSAAIAFAALFFAIYSWRQANRPLVSARVTSQGGSSAGIALNLLVENTGNRPARDIRLIAKESDILAALQQTAIPKDAQRCFFSGIDIPVLANGRSTSNGFWHLGQSDSWRAGAKIPVRIKYRDLSGRRFTSKVRLFLADDAGFAQTFWGDGHRH
ncbi:hypothetical protein NYL07_13950 [Xanthomonas translucens pv. translucens]|uniref:hypothetical protein n=1 Tax=Xanthomonas campestris pv. translucens TaxID=343 RepID=UPI000A479E48|nr:hypothetical protein [Xanthomonas translucens]MCS3360921.1 hypothetical protein [Xanthomonas translucens pv. translucens]MCS3374762.1 hypothetical protein [Xanthomonas translucens pv. translucens]MCT8290500.1 hypothetical protein [Xanthomonas translucens pv. translucens]MCT8294190.1 hypothetical protein [Xanthomonas translucens pv. translucens]MCT8314294.1 hypothetical protein [Xanthomonas translucens pv. translucens]